MTTSLAEFKAGFHCYRLHKDQCSGPVYEVKSELFNPLVKNREVLNAGIHIYKGIL